MSITLDAGSPSICSMFGGVASFLAVGTCVLDANQAGNGSVNPAAQVPQSISVGQGARTPAFTSSAPSSVTVGSTTYTPTVKSVIAGTNLSAGLPMALSIDATSASVCTISGGIVSFQSTGTCMIDGNEPDNGNSVGGLGAKRNARAARC